MKREEILEKLCKLFHEVSGNGTIQLQEADTAEDVEGWDSLTHVQLVVAIQQEFGITVSAREMQSWRCVGEILDSIQAKING